MDEFDDLQPEEADERDQHLIQDLRQLYSARGNTTKSLDYARQRLFQHPDAVTPDPRLTLLRPESAKPPTAPHNRHTRRRVYPLIGAIAAVILVGLLIGPFVLLRTRSHTDTTKKNVPALLPGPPSMIYDLHMVTETTGWARAIGLESGFTILRTSDGGINWRDVSPQGTEKPQYFTSVTAFLGTSTMWMAENTAVTSSKSWSADPPIAGTSSIFHTTDGGTTWKETPVMTREYTVRSLTFINAQEGWLLTEFEPLSVVQVPKPASPLELFHTTDGGTTWSKLPDSVFSSNQLFYNMSTTGMTFINAHTGWLAGSAGYNEPRLFSTHDGGNTWQQQQLPQPPGALSVPDVFTTPQFFTANDGILSGEYLGSKTDIVTYVTHNGGKSWNSSPLFSPPQQMGSYSVFETYGRASYWLFFSNNYVKLAAYFLPVTFTDIQHGWVQHFDGNSTALYVTDDGGQHWTKRFSFPNTRWDFLWPLQFTTTNSGWFLSADVSGHFPNLSTSIGLYQTTDRGRSWTSVHAHFPDFVTS